MNWHISTNKNVQILSPTAITLIFTSLELYSGSWQRINSCTELQGISQFQITGGLPSFSCESLTVFLPQTSVCVCVCACWYVWKDRSSYNNVLQRGDANPLQFPHIVLSGTKLFADCPKKAASCHRSRTKMACSKTVKPTVKETGHVLSWTWPSVVAKTQVPVVAKAFVTYAK